MAQEIIDRGTSQGDETGDTGFVGTGKINNNFTELFAYANSNLPAQYIYVPVDFSQTNQTLALRDGINLLPTRVVDNTSNLFFYTVNTVVTINGDTQTITITRTKYLLTRKVPFDSNQIARIGVGHPIDAVFAIIRYVPEVTVYTVTDPGDGNPDMISGPDGIISPISLGTIADPTEANILTAINELASTPVTTDTIFQSTNGTISTFTSYQGQEEMVGVGETAVLSTDIKMLPNNTGDNDTEIIPYYGAIAVDIDGTITNDVKPVFRQGANMNFEVLSDNTLRLNSTGGGSSTTINKKIIEVIQPFRAWQGVAVYDDIIYVFSDRDQNFGLSNTIGRYSLNGKFLSEVTNVYTQTDPGGNFMSFGSGMADDGTYFIIPTYNFNGGGSPLISRIARFDKTTLAYVDEFDIGGNVAESAVLYNNEWYVCYFDVMVVRKFSLTWNLVTEYNLSQTLLPNGGYQSFVIINDDFYFNWHGANSYGGTYTPGVDRYSFNGTAFTFIENIAAPTYGAGQGLSRYQNRFFWNDRPKNTIIITEELGEKVYEDVNNESVRTTNANLTNILSENVAVNGPLVVIGTFDIGNNNTIYRYDLGPLNELLIKKVFGAGGVVKKFDSPAGQDVQIIMATDNNNKFLIGYDAVTDAVPGTGTLDGYRIYNFGQSKATIFQPFGNDRVGFNGITNPQAKLDVDGGIKMANDPDTATSLKAGTIRYRTDSNNSYVEMCMQTGASSYAWVIISTNTW